MRLLPVLLVVVLAAPAAQARPSLCAAGEDPVLSCTTRSGRLVSLCASPDLSRDAGTLRYRYGRPGRIELVHPEGDVRARDAFRRGAVGNGYGDFVRFTRDGTTYTLVYAEGPRVPGGYHAAVRVDRGGRRIAEIPCDPARSPDTLGERGFAPVYRAGVPSEREFED